MGAPILILVVPKKPVLYECKVLGDFCSWYSKSRPTKDRGYNPANINKFNRQKENNDTVNSADDEILLQENKK